MSTTTAAGGALNRSLDGLVEALEQTEDLAGFRDGVYGYRLLLGTVDRDDPTAAAAVDVARIWEAVTLIASLVLAARQENLDG